MTDGKDFPLACPLPGQVTEKIHLGHGSGGKLTSQLIEDIFLPTFHLSSKALHDGVSLTVGNQKIAFTTDSYVVKPLFFPGGNIGHLAINGTVNDLAMCGASPLYLSCAFILEEGFDKDQLACITRSMQEAADCASVQLVTGDTKVIENARGDGLYLNTSGIGTIEKGVDIHPRNIQTGDRIIVNGDVGRHGTAIMSVREGLTFESTLESDTQELSSLVQALLQSEITLHCMRDITRGGLATVLVELAEASDFGIEIDENLVPINDTVRGACEFLGLDPLYVACEGRMVAFVCPSQTDKALEIMSAFGNESTVIGQVVESARAHVTAKTFVGTKRILDRLTGDQLPRIC